MKGIPAWAAATATILCLPQIACVVMAYLGPEGPADSIRAFAIAYGALMLCFAGGAWWGIAAGAPAAERRGGLALFWVAGALPPLFAIALYAAWLLFAIAPQAVLVMQGAALLLALAVDARAAALAPRWWMRLRLPLLASLGTATIAIALA
ncbi:MAG: DUF3429 domain-containing protein [Citromicrobium sp.]|nr:MAG: DUF3429 domain-containing protein [Citromicrobium sp.]